MWPITRGVQTNKRESARDAFYVSITEISTTRKSRLTAEFVYIPLIGAQRARGWAFREIRKS